MIKYDIDRRGDTVLEPGGNHRKVYVTADRDGLGIGDIAAREGISAGRINAEWLENNPEYGGSAGMALDQDAGRILWNWITGREADPSSHWLMLERGHEYGDLGRLIGRGATGESSDHPIVVTAWGAGADPVIRSEVRGYQDPFSNVAITDVDLERGMLLLGGRNVLLENLDFTGTGLNAQNVKGLTLRKSTITDVHYNTPQNGADDWDHRSKKQGVFIKSSDGVLIEDVFADMSGWEAGYDFNLSGSKPHAPSKFSHNLYIQKDNTDVTVRDNVLMRGAESGAQIRSGGVVDGNVFIGNDSAFNVGGSRSQVLNNVVTLAGYHEVADFGGALAWGIGNNGTGTVLRDNIVAHHTDPTDSAARASRTDPGKALILNTAPASNDTIVYNWETEKKGRADINRPDGVSAAALDAVTVKNFVEDVLGRNGGTDGIEALSKWLRQTWDSPRLESEMLVDYFQSGFRVKPGAGPTPEPTPEPEPEAPAPAPAPTPQPPASGGGSGGSGPDIGLGRTEVEALALSGYDVERIGDASGGAVVRTDKGEGRAAGVFDGPAGDYLVDVTWLNENDGAATFALEVDGTEVASWRGTGGSGGTGTAETKTVAVELARGDEIALEGRQGGFEYARFDSLDIFAADTLVFAGDAIA